MEGNGNFVKIFIIIESSDAQARSITGESSLLYCIVLVFLKLK